MLELVRSYARFNRPVCMFFYCIALYWHKQSTKLCSYTLLNYHILQVQKSVLRHLLLIRTNLGYGTVSTAACAVRAVVPLIIIISSSSGSSSSSSITLSFKTSCGTHAENILKCIPNYTNCYIRKKMKLFFVCKAEATLSSNF
jgi:hypothetical protein